MEIQRRKNKLREDSLNFAVAISKECDKIRGCSAYTSQLLRCSSSIGANIFEAKYAQSKLDFINKLEISLKEAYETEYWLELLFKVGKIAQTDYSKLMNECGSIRARLISSIKTAKGNRSK